MKESILREVTKIVTHDDCSDGLASAMICIDAITGIRADARVEFVQYGTKKRDELEAHPGLLFVDMTPPEARAQEFVDAGAIVLDHHKGAQELVEGFGERGVFADEKVEPGVAGAMLAYREVWTPLMGERVSRDVVEHVGNFAKLISIRDTWQKDSPSWDMAEAAHMGLLFFPRGGWLTKGCTAFGEEHITVGRIAHEKRLDAARRAADGAVRFVVDGYKFAVFMDGDRWTSNAADMLRNEGVDVVCGFFYTNPDGEPQIVFSLRSNGRFDVAKFAKHNGGGGHTKAAGFSVTLSDNEFQPFAQFELCATSYVRAGLAGSGIEEVPS